MSRPVAEPEARLAALSPPIPGRTASTGASVRVLAWLGPLVLAVAAVPLYARISWSMFINSDDANTALQGLDIAHGNLLLHGWTLSGSPFYLVEMPIFAAVAAVLGIGPDVVHIASAIVYMVFLAIAALLAATGLSRRGAWLAAAVAVTLLAAPAGFVVRFLLLGPYHLGTAAAMMAALLAIGRLSGWRRNLAVCAILTAGAVSDPLTVWVGVTGIAGTLLLRLLLVRHREEWPLLVSAVASALLAQGLLRGVRHVGGFRTLHLAANLASPGDLVRNAHYVSDGVRLLFGAAPSGGPASAPGIWFALHLLLLVLALGAAVWATLAVLRGRLEVTMQMALVVIVLDVAATIVSAQSVDIGALRYLMPAYGLLAVIAGRTFGPALARGRLWLLAGALAAAQLVFLLSVDVTQPVAPSARAALESYLVAHRLRHGLGQYWDASSVTVETRGRVTVRAVFGASGQVWPYLWESNRDWYAPGADGPATFVLEPLDGTGPEQASVLHAFGPPERVLTYAGYRIEVWNRDLAPLLSGT